MRATFDCYLRIGECGFENASVTFLNPQSEFRITQLKRRRREINHTAAFKLIFGWSIIVADAAGPSQSQVEGCSLLQAQVIA
jgi:hypothetical protein